MVGDLVDEDVADERVEADVAALAPLVEDRAAVEPDHVGCRRLVHDRALGEGDPLVEAGEFEGVVDVEVVEHVVGGEVGHGEAEVAAGPAHLGRQVVEGGRGQRLDVLERRRGGGQAIGDGSDGHDPRGIARKAAGGQRRSRLFRRAPRRYRPRPA